MQKQNIQSCEFDGLGMITFFNPSMGQYRFLVGVAGRWLLGRFHKVRGCVVDRLLSGYWCFAGSFEVMT